jgi:phage gpG-like protein
MGFNFGNINRRVDNSLKRAILKIGANAVVFFRRNFDNEGFTNVTNQRWQARKATGKRALRHKILNKSGALKASIRVRTAVSALTTVVSSDMDYSNIHNADSAAERQGKAWGTPFTMPQRKFIGDSEVMDKQMEKIILTEIDKLFI